MGVALVYMLLTIPLAKLIKYLEERMSTDREVEEKASFIARVFGRNGRTDV